MALIPDPHLASSNAAVELTRRRFAGLIGAAGVTAAAGAVPAFAPVNAAEEEPFEALDRGRPLPRPNILVILGDDLGWADLSSYGAPTIRTPNLDRLAASGVRFTQAYSASSVCSPTPLRPLHRPLSRSARRRPSGTDRLAH